MIVYRLKIVANTIYYYCWCKIVKGRKVCVQYKTHPVEEPKHLVWSFFFFLISLIADAGPHHYLPSCLWSLRIFPSLPACWFTPYDFLSRYKFSTLTTRQPMVGTYSRSHAFRYERKSTNPTLVRIELTPCAPSLSAFRFCGFLVYVFLAPPHDTENLHNKYSSVYSYGPDYISQRPLLTHTHKTKA